MGVYVLCGCGRYGLCDDALPGFDVLGYVVMLYQVLMGWAYVVMLYQVLMGWAMW